MGQDIINEVKSTLVSVNDLIAGNNRYNIPRYQRLFVWEDEQVETLLQDLYEAYKVGRELFYLGGVLTVKQPNSEGIFDLIDGQQRFTTLWLLAIELKGALQEFTEINNKLRLKFSIREEATNYFETILKNNLSEAVQISTDNTSLLNIDRARGRINKFIEQELKNEPNIRQQFAEYIRHHVKLIVSEVPHDTDLNKLFEVINNRGEQLQHHEILKASILSHFQNKQERIRYGKIWNAVSDMDTYIEKAIQVEVGRNLSEAFNPSLQTFDLTRVLEIMTERRSRVSKSMNLNSILNGELIEYEEDEKQEEYTMYTDEHPDAHDDELQKVRSILTFSQLLLHALRIHLFENDLKDIQRINEKELLHTFKEHCKIENEKEAKGFISLLWEIRVCFDLYIIKWVKQAVDEEVHLIKPLEKYNQYRKWTYYLRRRVPEESDGFALLQSMLYHSQQITTHYWLTPLLYKAYSTRNKEQLFAYLRQLDNVLFCTQKVDTLPERTLKAMQIDLSTEKENYSCHELANDWGVAFPHYWFYKTEFVLWYLLKDRQDERNRQLWRSFKMTAKNSVEHISPQNPNYKADIVSKIFLNKFGNLALVSRSINSEFSNKPFREKRERFLYHNAVKLDSLKLALVYQNDIWNDTLCKAHEEEIDNYFQEYLTGN